MKNFFYSNILCVGLLFSCQNSSKHKLIKDLKQNAKAPVILQDHLGHSHIVYQSLSENVSNLKSVITDMTGFPSEELRVMKAGRLLSLDLTLENLGITSYDILDFFVPFYGGTTMLNNGPNPNKEKRANTVPCDSTEKALRPGLNIEVYCKLCKKTSMHKWHTSGNKGNKDTGIDLSKIKSRSKCQWCDKAVEDEDYNGDPYVEVRGMYFYRCWYEWSGRISEFNNSLNKNKWYGKKNIEVATRTVGGSEYAYFDASEFLIYQNCTFRMG